MATTDFGQQTTRRKRWIAGVIAVGLGATMMTIATTYRRHLGRREEKSVSPLPTLPSNVHEQLSGYSFTRSDDERRIFTVRAARTVAFEEGGATILEDVYVEFFGRADNRRDVLRTGRCEYKSLSDDFFGPGKVELELKERHEAKPGTLDRGSEPVFIETSAVSFNHATSLVATEQLVRFRVGPASGTARGLTYTVKEGGLELKHEVTGELSFKTPGELPARLTASKMRYDRSRAEIVLFGPLEIIQGKRRVQAERGTVSLDDHNRITRAALEGGVRAWDSSAEVSLEFHAARAQGVFDPATAQPRNLMAEGEVVGEFKRAGTTSQLSAQKFEMNLEGVRPQPQNAHAWGKVRVTIDSAPDPESPKFSGQRKVLTAPEMGFAFRPDGRSLHHAETVGESKLTLVPLDVKVGERVITANQFVMAFDEQSRLESLVGRGETRMVFEPPPVAPPESVPQETSADRLEAAFDSATGGLRTVEQTGDFRFREGDRQARSDQARYASRARLLTMTGHPLLWDSESRIKADRVVFDLTTDTAEGRGKVQGTHLEVPDPSGPSRSRASPADSADPINVVADRMVALRRDQFVHYEGNVRAWRGQDVVESVSLDVYRKQRRLRSGLGVLTSFIQSTSRPTTPVARASGSAPAETRPVTVRADRLDYVDPGREASYRGNVRLQAEGATLQADHLDVFLSKGGSAEASQVDRAVADGHVTVTQPGRRAAGEHGDYDAAQGKVVLTGGPPTIYDAQKGFVTGQRLTFYIHDDRLLVDGGNKSPTLSKHRVAQ